MVRRPWIILVTLVVLFLAFSGIVTFRYLNRSNALRDRILSELSQAGAVATLKQATLNANGVVLHGFSWSTRDSSLTVAVDRASIRASAANLIRHPGDLPGAIESVSLAGPAVVYRPDRASGKAVQPDEPPAFPSLADWSDLERLILIGGSFRIETGPGDVWFELADVEGAVTGRRGSTVELDVSASLPGDTVRTIDVYGSGDLANPSLNARLDAGPLALASVTLPESSPLGDLAGQFELHARGTLTPGGWDALASWELNGASLLIDESIRVDRINLTGLLENKLLTTSGSIRFEGDEGDVDAELDLTAGPTLRASADVPEVEIGRQLGTFAGLTPDERPEGKVASTGDFTYDLSTGRMELTAVAQGPVLASPAGDFRDVRLDFSWDNERHELRFDHIATEWYGLNVTGAGRYRPSREIPFVVEATYNGHGKTWDLPEWLAPIESKTAEGRLTINDLPDEGWVIRTEARVLTDANPSVGEFQGRYSAHGYDARLDLYALQLPDASLRVHTSSVPVNVQATQPQIVATWWDEDIEFSEHVRGMDVRASGRIERDSVRTRATIDDPVTGFSLKLSGASRIDSVGAVLTTAGYGVQRNGRFVGNGELTARYHDDRLTITDASFMDAVRVAADLDFAASRFRNLSVTIEELDAGYLIPALAGIPDGLVGGSLNGRFRMRGPFARPDVTAHLELFGGRYGELTDYWGLITFATDSLHNVRVRQGAFGRAGTTLFTLIGGYSIPDDEVDLYVETPGSDANTITAMLTGNEDLLKGEAGLRGRVHGPLALPSWDAEFSMTGGRISGIYFDTVDVRLRGETSERLGHVLYFDRFEFDRPEHYHLAMTGAAPLSRGAGEIELSLSGDILSLFPQWSAFIEQASGAGELSWTTTVVAGRLVASRGDLSIRNGSARFKEVFPPLTDLDVKMSVDPDGNALVEKFAGEFDEQYGFEMRNRPGGGADSTRLPVRFALPPINFGVLELRTVDENGIPFRLPGISTTDGYARLAMQGKGDSDWFTIAGPADRLYLDGRLRLTSARFTFPPVPEEDEVDILASIIPRGALFLDEEQQVETEIPGSINHARWDVNAYVGHDVHFARIVKGLENTPFLETFSSFLGQVVLNVDLEPTEPGWPIHVSGTLADESFRLAGKIVSTEGRIEFLDLLFEMDRAEVQFDPTSIYPVVSMRAVTNVIEEEFTRQMYLTLYVIDPVTGERVQRGRWGEFTFVLEDDIGSSQEEVLSAMGVGISDLTGLQNRVITSGAGEIGRAVARRWLRPIEREAADWLGLDLVHFRPQFTQNLIGPNPTDFFSAQAEDDQRTTANSGRKNLFRASRITLGKYIDRNIFISYTGQFGEEARYATVEDIQLGRLGLLQKWNLEYRVQPISPNFVLELGWEYENVENVNYRSARMKYSVVFDLMSLSFRNLQRTALRR
ncbi:MAG: hypothetical protein MAG453_01808 [Calditrichaeota bacterium]|nr:hypothetical protein [Calditrichota bacterium]